MLPLSNVPPLTSEQETELVARMIQGDTEARDQLVLANDRRAALFTAAVCRHFPHAEQDDIFQTARLMILEACSSYDPDRGTRFGTYVHATLAKGLAYYAGLTDEPTTISIDGEHEDEGSLHEVLAEPERHAAPSDPQLIRIIETGMAQATPRERQVFRMLLDGSPSQRDIATMLHIKQPTVNRIIKSGAARAERSIWYLLNEYKAGRPVHTQESMFDE